MHKKELVVPGTYLSIEEEYLAGANAYGNSAGSVFSETVGCAEFSREKHEVDVAKCTPGKKAMERGNTVIARVANVKDQTVLVEIVGAYSGDEPRIVNVSYAGLAIFNVTNGFVKDMESVYRTGDILKAKIDEMYPYGAELHTKEDELGVIKAFCTKCRKPLRLFGSELKCTSCSSSESRKISSDYLVK